VEFLQEGAVTWDAINPKRIGDIWAARRTVPQLEAV
jgi:hypothetical protein